MKKLILLVLAALCFEIGYSQKSNKIFMNNFYDGVSYMYENNYDAALECWKKAEDMDPENPNVWYNLGVCYKNTAKDRELAVEYLTKCLDYVNPNYVYNDHTERTVPIDCYMQLGMALRMVGRYDESTEVLATAKEVAAENGKSGLEKIISEEIVTTDNAKNISEQKMCKSIRIRNLGDVVNSSSSDHSPVITCDGKTLYFTSKRLSELNESTDEKIYVTRKNDDGEWSSPELLPAPINTKGKNESAVSISPDGKRLYFFRSGSSLQGNLYYSDLGSDGTWGKPKHLNSDINTKYRESHIVVAPDGNSIFFTSDRPDGFGGLDIYMLKKQSNGKWSDPILLPAEVNTSRDEEYPFVHPNGSMLYFNSKGHESVGGYDVFFSKINDDGTFSKAESMCCPINTPDNDICYTLSCDGKTAYLTGVRQDSYGEYDIYEIADLSEAPLITYQGSVKYADNAIPKGMVVWVKDKSTGEDLGSYEVDENTGKYNCDLRVFNEYSLTYSKNGDTVEERSKTPSKEEDEKFQKAGEPLALEDFILPLTEKEAQVTVYDNEGLTSDAVSVLDDVMKLAEEMKEESRQMIVNLEFDENKLKSDSPQMKKVTDYLGGKVKSSDISYNQKPEGKNLYNIKVSYVPEVIADKGGDAIVDDRDPDNVVYTDTLQIRNVYFDFDKYEVKSKYKGNLNELAEFMKENPGVKIEIGGHADYVGTDDYNYLLSGRRATAVKDYLVGMGVKQDKIEVVKYGESRPIASNANSTRKYNRRVDFRVLVQGEGKYLKVVSENVKAASANVESHSDNVDGKKVYRVQVFALTHNVPVESFGIPDLKMRELNGFYKYYFGEYDTYESAEAALEQIKTMFPSAMIMESK